MPEPLPPEPGLHKGDKGPLLLPKLSLRAKHCPKLPPCQGSATHALGHMLSYPPPHFTDGRSLLGQGLRVGEGLDLALKLRGAKATPSITTRYRLGASREWSVLPPSGWGSGRPVLDWEPLKASTYFLCQTGYFEGQSYSSSIRLEAPKVRAVPLPSDWEPINACTHLLRQTGGF